MIEITDPICHVCHGKIEYVCITTMAYKDACVSLRDGGGIRIYSGPHSEYDMAEDVSIVCTGCLKKLDPTEVFKFNVQKKLIDGGIAQSVIQKAGSSGVGSSQAVSPPRKWAEASAAYDEGSLELPSVDDSTTSASTSSTSDDDSSEDSIT